MYSLFWKIFFTCWVIILSIELFTAWFTANLSESELHPILERQHQQFTAESHRVAEVLREGGLAGLRNWLDIEGNRQAIDELFVVNAYGVEVVRNQTLPNHISKIISLDNANFSGLEAVQPIKNILTQRAEAPEGSYVVVSTFKHPPLMSYLLAPQRVAFGVIVSGLICLLLARYFTLPLTKLRRSTQMLTNGEFNTSSIQNLRKRNDEFGALAIDFETMSRRLSELLSAKRQLLRDISHELRSPLARIRVALGLARKQDQFRESKEFDRIELEVERLESLISELLMFVKIRSTDGETNLAPIDLRELLENIIEDAQYEQQQSDSVASIQLQCPGELQIMADAHLLYRAIDNVLRNALRYSPAGSFVRVVCEREGASARIKIEDSGPGVPETMLEAIFQPFVRVSSARESETGGSGIGLAIVKRVVEMHGGAVEACNNPAGGLIISIELPLRDHLQQRSAA